MVAFIFAYFDFLNILFLKSIAATEATRTIGKIVAVGNSGMSPKSIKSP